MALSGPKGSVRTKLEVTGSREYKRRMKEADDSLDRFAKTAGKTKDAFGDLANQWTAATAGIAIAGAAIVRVVQEVGNAIVALGMRGGEVSAVAGAFERIASPEVLRNMQEATGYLLTSQELAQEYVQIYRANLLDESQIDEFMGLVARAAQDTGENTAEMIRSAANALAGGGLEVFQRLGVNIGEIRDQLERQNLTMEDNEGKTRALVMIQRQLEQQTEGTNNAAGNLNDAFTQLNNSAEDYYDNLARGVSESPAAIAAVTALANAIRQTTGEQDALNDVIGEGFFDAVVGMSRMAEELTGFLRDLARQLGAVHVAAGGGARALGLTGLADQLSTIGTSFEDIGNGLNVINQRARETWRNAMNTRAELERSGVTGGDPSRLRAPRSRGQGADVGRAMISWGEAFADELERAGEAWAENQDVFTDIVEFQDFLAEGETEEMERRIEKVMSLEEAYANLAEVEREEAEEAARLAEEAADAAQERFDKTIAGFENVAEGTASIFSNITQIMEETGSSAEAVANAEGAFLIAYNSVMAATEVAKAIGAYPDVVGMIQHGLAAAAHVTAAVLAGVQLGGGTATATAAPSAGSFTPAEPPAPTTETGTGGTVIYNDYKLGRTNSEIGEAVTESEFDFLRGGGTPFRDIAPVLR
jgi:hypothetical protein